MNTAKQQIYSAEHKSQYTDNGHEEKRGASFKTFMQGCTSGPSLSLFNSTQRQECLTDLSDLIELSDLLSMCEEDAFLWSWQKEKVKFLTAGWRNICLNNFVFKNDEGFRFPFHSKPHSLNVVENCLFIITTTFFRLRMNLELKSNFEICN